MRKLLFWYGYHISSAISFTIQLGSHTLEEGDDNRLIVSTSEYVIHPSFEPTSMKNDIALLKLRVPISYSSRYNTQKASCFWS